MGNIFKSGFISLFVRLVLGFFFIYASVEKIAFPEVFARSIEAYQLMPIVVINIIAIVLPWLELFCGLFLISGLLVRASVFIINCLLLVFITVIITAIFRGLEIDCGCFGSANPAPVSWLRVAEDVGLFILGLILYFFPKSVLSVESILNFENKSSNSKNSMFGSC